jgi:hypothetical protein
LKAVVYFSPGCIEKLLNSPDQFAWSSKLMLPDPHDTPPASPQFTICVTIPFTIFLQFWPPVGTVRFRQLRMELAAMPKATINEDG